LLSNSTCSVPWYKVQRCSSTQDLARQLWSHRDFIPALCIQAEEQASGRGTWGRSWVSHPGNLFLTVSCRHSALRDTAALPQAVAEALLCWLNTHGLQATIRGINDIMIAGRKVCGILVEQWQLPEKVIVAVGVGINCISAPAITEIEQPATCLAQHGLELHPDQAAQQIIAPVLRCMLPIEEHALLVSSPSPIAL